MTELLGYTVEDLGSKEPGKVAYKLHGKRSAVYSLIRNMNNPKYMFATNSNGNVCGLKGNYTFTDRDGELDVYYSVCL